MAHANEILFLLRQDLSVTGAVLEVGSKEYGHFPPGVYRRMFPSAASFTGTDLEDGPNVDVVGDLTSGLCGLPAAGFDLIICCSVLEHVIDLPAMTANIEALLAPAGTLYVAVPWVWRFHAYPHDYRRLSWSGIHSAFPRVDWRDPVMSTYKSGEFFSLVERPNVDDEMSVMHDGRKYLPYLQTHCIGTKRAAA